MKRTDNPSEVGQHLFERAGLGKAPFRFQGITENVIRNPDGSVKAGGCCDYCSTGIRSEFWIESADGKRFKVGCDCIAKVGDAGLILAYKNSPAYREKQRLARVVKDQAVQADLDQIIGAESNRLQSLAHPMAFTDRQTGRPMTALDYALWMRKNCGASGRATVLRVLKRLLPSQSSALQPSHGGSK